MKSSIEKVFLGKNPLVYLTYLRIVEAIKQNIGQVEINSKKTCIHLTSKSDFGGVHPKKNWLDFNMVLDHPIEDERIIRCEQVSKNRFHNYFRLNTPDDIDTKFTALLKESYKLMS